jgi:hypothetical protein
MPSTRIARFSASLATFVAAMSAATQVSAAGDPFQEALGIDYGRQLLLAPTPPRSQVGALPGFAEPGLESEAFPIGPDSAEMREELPVPPRLSMLASVRQLDLIRKEGGFAFAHRRTSASLDISLAAIPHLELRFAADQTRRALSLGDSAASVDMGGETWGWRGAARIRVSPFLVPTLIVAGESAGNPHGDALEAIALQGSLPVGLAWSLALGRKRLDYPVDLRLSGYSPISLPLQLRQDFQTAAVSFREGPWEAAWAGHWMQADLPVVQPQGYALGDSGSAWRQDVLAAYERMRAGNGFRASLAFDVGLGRHVFRGINRKGENLYPFSWQEGAQKDYALRGDFRYACKRAVFGTWIGGGESEYDALRPETAFNKHLWDRNGVIDSYEGSLLGIFNNETWLMNGAAYAAQAGAGLWEESWFAGWRYRLGLGYQYLLLQANSHLTRRQTSFLLAYQEETFDATYPTIEADLVPVQVGLYREWGNLSLEAKIMGEIPARVRIYRTPGKGGGEERGSPEYSGGTSGGFRIGYSLP